jgi:16S rRNA processing protein RimM
MPAERMHISPVFCSVMNKKDFFYFGKAAKTNKKTAHLTVSVDADNPESYTEIRYLFFEIDGGLVPFFVEDLRLIGNDTFRVSLEDWNEPDKVQQLVGRKIYLPVTMLKELDEEQFYFHEIIGYEMIDKTLGVIGKITDVFEPPEQVLLQVHHKGKEVLIPFADDLFININKPAKRLYMDLPDGLIDIYLES